MCSGSRGGTVVRALASLRCGPDAIPRLDISHLWLEFLVGTLLALRGFSLGYYSFPLASKTNISVSNLIQNLRATGLSVARLFSGTLVKLR